MVVCVRATRIPPLFTLQICDGRWIFDGGEMVLFQCLWPLAKEEKRLNVFIAQIP